MNAPKIVTLIRDYEMQTRAGKRKGTLFPVKATVYYVPDPAEGQPLGSAKMHGPMSLKDAQDKVKELFGADAKCRIERY